jgi:1-deoxyxylulose-5-phosphate synthase
MTAVALGTMMFGRWGNPDEGECRRMVDIALDRGVTLFDTADIYDFGTSEEYLGRALAGRRDGVAIATKVGNAMSDDPSERGLSRRWIHRSCESSLRRLGVDHIDLYQMHRPDPDTPVEETLAALTDLVRSGKVRYVGCSTHPAWQVMEALMVSELKGYVRYVSEQPPYNLLDRRIENELVPLCLRHGLAIIPWAPMAQGVLAGRYDDAAAPPADSRAARRGGIYGQRVTPAGVEVGRRFASLARDAGIPADQLALLWVREQPGVTAPIYGPRTLAQLESILPMLELSLSDELRAACDELVPPGSAVTNFHNSAAWMKMRIG